jgi:hypothetical protein
MKIEDPRARGMEAAGVEHPVASGNARHSGRLANPKAERSGPGFQGDSDSVPSPVTRVTVPPDPDATSQALLRAAGHTATLRRMLERCDSPAERQALGDVLAFLEGLDDA